MGFRKQPILGLKKVKKYQSFYIFQNFWIVGFFMDP